VGDDGKREDQRNDRQEPFLNRTRYHHQNLQ
jgi:hypothetical protein